MYFAFGMYSAFIVGDQGGDFGLFPFHLMLFMGFGYVFFKSVFLRLNVDCVPKKYQTLLATSLTIVLYFLFGYGLDRTDFTVLFATYTILFVPFFLCSKKRKNEPLFFNGNCYIIPIDISFCNS